MNKKISIIVGIMVLLILSIFLGKHLPALDLKSSNSKIIERVGEEYFQKNFKFSQKNSFFRTEDTKRTTYEYVFLPFSEKEEYIIRIYTDEKKGEISWSDTIPPCAKNKKQNCDFPISYSKVYEKVRYQIDPTIELIKKDDPPSVVPFLFYSKEYEKIKERIHGEYAWLISVKTGIKECGTSSYLFLMDTESEYISPRKGIERPC